MKKINILYLIDQIDFIGGGTEKQLYFLINGLRKEMFRVYLCCLRKTDWFQQHSSRFNCPTFVLNLKSLFGLSMVRKLRELRRFIKEKEIDIVQTLFVDARVVGCLATRPLNNTVLIHSRRSQGYWVSQKQKLISRFFNRYIDYFLCNSEDTKLFISKAEKIPVTKIHIIYNALDLRAFQLINEALTKTMRARLEIPEHAVVIGCVADLRPVKAINILIEGFKQFLTHNQEAYCILVGDGPCRNDLQKQCNELGISNRVIFAGYHEDVIPYLATFDIGVLCSLSESFSNSVLEYQAAGIPTIATEVGGIKEVINEGVNGLIVPPGDSLAISKALNRLAQDRQLLAQMKVQAHQLIQKFSLDRMINEHQYFYQNIVAKNLAGQGTY